MKLINWLLVCWFVTNGSMIDLDMVRYIQKYDGLNFTKPSLNFKMKGTNDITVIYYDTNQERDYNFDRIQDILMNYKGN